MLTIPMSQAIAVDKIQRQFPETHRLIANVELGESSREKVLSLFGSATPWSRADEHHDSFRYCYQLQSQEPAWLILGFGWSYSFEKLDFIAVTRDKRDLHGPCSRFKMSDGKVATQGGLRLGLAKSDVKAIFADKPTTDSEMLEYEYELYEKYPKPVRMPGNPFLYVGEYHYGLIEIHFSKDRVSKFFLWISGEPAWE